MVLQITFLGCFLCLVANMAAAQASATSRDVNNIVQGMMTAQQENKARIRPVTIKRDYRLLDKQDVAKAQMVANITLLPPDDQQNQSQQYQIESSSGGMGEKVLRDILSKETESAKDAQKRDISPDNYEFTLLGEETLNGRRCYLLGMNPKRDAKDLMRGKVWVDAENYNIHRIEGSPVKNPSWWIHDLYILMSFAEVDGMWMRTFTHAVANVRFKGKYSMDSRDVEYRPIVQTASRSHHRNSGILAGAAIRP
ncbi:MAG TPA: outer membrane lipoprotein-sorting protein [Candidatus Angelobacter sp.]|nr:outer membrane lipoprotein-sorting protein [Candidatus Angelobacter sp.]